MHKFEAEKDNECANGKYFWTEAMIVVKQIDLDTILQTIDDLISGNEFEQAFQILD